MLTERALAYVEQHMDVIVRRARRGDGIAKAILSAHKRLRMNMRDPRSRVSLRRALSDFKKNNPHSTEEDYP
jgi:hypothetical protein